MAKYTVQSPVKSGGKIHDIGATIVLDDATAAPLVALGRITALGGAKNSSDDASSDANRDAARQAAESKDPDASAPSTKKTGGKK